MQTSRRGCQGSTILAAEPSSRTRRPHSGRPKPSQASKTQVPTFLPCAQGRTTATNTPTVSVPWSTLEQQRAPPDAAVTWDTIHVGHMPLVGFEPVAAMLPDRLTGLVQLHTFLALGSSQHPHDQCMVLDFLPERPTDPSTALALASGGSTPGQFRVRRLKGWIQGGSIRTRLVLKLGRALSDREALEAVDRFNSRWDSRLRLLHNDCRHYTAALLTSLSGEQFCIDDL
ncbi:hypothetical protein PLESTB_000996400 [Pleodorina starrii]|uniref:Uncharacterized protein n=1 Tax=Pleodorina starrii TaxID=330485 RepID=A0A9W6BQ52_9CHLO|nr:hypothetical protein PLESTM_001855400 [Pleodorina starrii]GLC55521.1 hypothetical protein PLESTB_000996400 [Pleodorina starrii]GLC76402.1 hypothetical protein PLESTF_001776600 [Pleodorina starrii]